MVTDYIGIPHNYGEFDCIILIQRFYSVELGLQFELPSYPSSRSWMKQFSISSIEQWAAKYAKKVSLTDIKNYDLMVFKSEKSNLVTHFGLYIEPYRILHVEEGSTSRLDYLTDYWLSQLCAIYRHNELVQ